MGNPFAGHRELGNCRARCGFARLTTGVGIHFRVEHQDVDVASAGKHVVETTVADIVCPAVTAHDPDGFLDQAVCQADQVFRTRIA